MVKGLVTAIVRKAQKHYPNAGIVGVYAFDNGIYRTKAELREAVQTFCEKLTWEQIPIVQRNFGL